MRLSRRTYIVFFLILATALCLNGGKPTPIFDPPPFPDDLPPWPDDPPPIFDDPFDPNTGLPNPLDLPPPPEDPFDDPLPTPLDLPDPPDFLDPFPDLPSLLSDPFEDFPPPPDLPPPPPVTHEEFARPRAVGSATNVPTPLTPFPMRLPFHPAYSGVNAPRTKPSCNPAMSESLVCAEPRKNTVAFVSVCARKTMARVNVGQQPVGVKATPDRTQVWVANSGSGSISIIDFASKTVVGTINLPPLHGAFPAQPNNIAFLPDGTRAYVTDHDAQSGSTVYVIDVASQAVIQQIGVGNFPSGMAVSPDGSQVWITCRADNNVYVIDTLTNTVIQVIANISLPTGITFNPTGTTVYVAEGNPVGGVVAVIDPGTFTVLNTIAVGDLPHIVKISPSGHYLFVTNLGSNSISVIATMTDKVLYNVKFPNGAVHPLGLSFIY